MMIFDEETANEVWLEAAHENFDESLESGDYETAKAIADDLFDKGFKAESVSLMKKLVNTKVKDF